MLSIPFPKLNHLFGRSGSLIDSSFEADNYFKLSLDNIAVLNFLTKHCDSQKE